MRGIFFDSYGDLRAPWFVLAVLGGAILLILLVCILAGVPLTAIEYAQCAHLESIDQVNTYDWSFWSSCRVMTQDGFYVNVDSLGAYELIHGSPR